MKQKLKFQNKNKKQLEEFLSKNKKRKIVNFLNLETLGDFSKQKDYEGILNSKNHINFADGTTIALFLSLKKLKKFNKNRGPTFTKEFLTNPEKTKNKKHFFIIELGELPKEKFSHIKKESTRYFYPSFPKGTRFSKEEIKEIAKKINKFKPDFVWLGISSPKQHFLAHDLFEKTSAKYFFTVGAAIDFLIERKKESPIFVNKIGMEWIYRGITDFKYSKKKILKSFASLRHLVRAN